MTCNTLQYCTERLCIERFYMDASLADKLLKIYIVCQQQRNTITLGSLEKFHSK
jgi:hypothetical protein